MEEITVKESKKCIRGILGHNLKQKAKSHIGKKFQDVPELFEIINAISVIDKYCKD